MKKGREPLLYTLSSLTSFLLDTGLFYGLHLLFSAALGIYAEPVCNLAARALSSFYNFNMNRLVFRSRGSYGKEILKYYCLCIPQALASTGLITLLVNLIHPDNSAGVAAVKVAIDGILFVVSFFIQKFWVFRRELGPVERNNNSASDREPEKQTKSNKKIYGSEDRKEQNHDL